MGTVRRIDDNRGVAVRRYQHGERVRSIAMSLGRSRWWVYKWLARAATGGPAWATDRSRRLDVFGERFLVPPRSAVCLRRRDRRCGTPTPHGHARWRPDRRVAVPASVPTAPGVLAMSWPNVVSSMSWPLTPSTERGASHADPLARRAFPRSLGSGVAPGRPSPSG